MKMEKSDVEKEVKKKKCTHCNVMATVKRPGRKRSGKTARVVRGETKIACGFADGGESADAVKSPTGRRFRAPPTNDFWRGKKKKKTIRFKTSDAYRARVPFGSRKTHIMYNYCDATTTTTTVRRGLDEKITAARVGRNAFVRPEKKKPKSPTPPEKPRPITPETGGATRSAACSGCPASSGRPAKSAARSGSWAAPPGACRSGAAWRPGCCDRWRPANHKVVTCTNGPHYGGARVVFFRFFFKRSEEFFTPSPNHNLQAFR